MTMGKRKTGPVYDRYNIVSESDRAMWQAHSDGLSGS